MNCRQTRDLTSAYLDQELTGRQMLEIRAHLAECDNCAQEWQEVREVRLLLRSLVPPLPDIAAQRQLVARLDREAQQEAGMGVLMAFLLRWMPPLHWERLVPTVVVDLRPRGRRLASALALSSVAILAAAAPFAPSTGDAVGHVSAPSATQAGAVSASLVTLPSLRYIGPLSLLHFMAVPAAPPAPPLRAPTLARQYTQSAVQTMDTEPFRDEAVSGYVQGATLADYQSAGTSAR